MMADGRAVQTRLAKGSKDQGTHQNVVNGQQPLLLVKQTTSGVDGCSVSWLRFPVPPLEADDCRKARRDNRCVARNVLGCWWMLAGREACDGGGHKERRI